MTSSRRIGFLFASFVVSVTAMLIRSPFSTPRCFAHRRTHQRRVVPGQLRDRVGQFLEPAVVDVAAVIHRSNCASGQSPANRASGSAAVAQSVWATPPALFAVERRRLVLAARRATQNRPAAIATTPLAKSPGGAVARNVSCTSSGPSIFGPPSSAFISSISDIPPKSGRIIGWTAR